MTTLSNTSAVTRITAAWRGHKIYTIFRKASNASTWEEFDALYNESLADAERFPGRGERASAWARGLYISEINLINNSNYEDDRQHMCYAGDEDTTDWWWNDGGGYADW